jgi:oligoribonuclease NrnB/cAMP/cGMP phosphodiesterase (DHH superfamily)
MRQVCVYHAGCPDGFGAAWSVWKAWRGEGTYIARGHEDRLRGRDFEDALVAVVDIAPDNRELRDLADHAAQVLILDHHITSLERLDADRALQRDLESEGHRVHFDLSHSGAVLAWRHFHPDSAVPELLHYVEDQDLWNWSLDDSDAVNAAIASYPRRFDIWEQLAARPIAELVQEGRPILRSNRMEVERAITHAAPIAVGTRRVESINSSTNRAAIGHALAERKAYGESWGCVYRIDGSRVHATLYSIGDFDVAAIAVSLGGGGHKNAAGFSATLEEWVRDFAC